MKKFTKEQLQKINEFMDNKGFLEKKDVFLLRSEFKYSYETFKRELMENKIPFKSGNPINILISFGVNVEGNKIELNDFLSLEQWKLEVFKNSKIRVQFECKECGLKADSRLSKIINREFFPIEPICSCCINRVVRRTDEVKRRNSDAQIIAQNRPDVKEKNRISQIKRFENIEAVKKHSEAAIRNWQNKNYRDKMVEIAKNKWKDPEYAKKVIENSKNGGLKGFYKEIYYDSGYELAWLMILESNNKLSCVERANFYISYKNIKNKTSYYYPDFILDKKYIIEVKGYGPWVNNDNITKKNEAAKLWCKSNNMKYRLIEFSDIGNIWYKKARKKHKEINNG